MVAAERAAEESEDRHMAVTLIASIFRGRKARDYIVQKRCQVMLGRALDIKRDASKAAIVIQHNYRGFSTRKELQLNGFKMPADKALAGVKKKRRNRKMKKLLEKERSEADTVTLKMAVATRVGYELRQRRVNDRAKLLYDVLTQYLQTVQFLRAASNTWISNDWKRVELLHKYEAAKDEESKVHFEFQKDAGSLESSLNPSEKKSNVAYTSLQTKVKQSFEKIKSLDSRIAVLKNIGDWVLMVVRSHLRRKSIIEERFEDMIKRLHWISVESASVERIITQLEYRKAAIGHKRSFGNVVRWIARHYKSAVLLNADLDAQQESVLKDIHAKLIQDHQNSTELESLANELVNALKADSHTSAERSYLERMIMQSKPGSDEMVFYSEKLLKIKQNQLQLSVNVIDTIKGGLEDRFKREDEQTIGIAGFPDDDPDLPVGKLPAAIKAQLLDTFKSRSHITTEDFFSVVYSQPWLSEEAVLDVRFEEKINELRLQLNTLMTEAKLLDAFVTESRDNISDTKGLIGELRAEIDLIQHGGDYEGDLTREEAIAALEQEIVFKENELSIMESDLNNKVELVEPNARKSAILSEELVKFQEIFESRLKERVKSIEDYFKLETTVNHDAEDYLRIELVKNENQIADIKEVALFFECSEDKDLPKRTVVRDLDLSEYKLLQIAREDGRFDEQVALHKSKPSQYIQTVEYSRMYIKLQERVVRANTGVLESVRDLLQDEKKFVKKFVSQRKSFEEKMKVFMNSQLALRRQRSVAKEIVLRRKRYDITNVNVSESKGSFEQVRRPKRKQVSCY